MSASTNRRSFRAFLYRKPCGEYAVTTDPCKSNEVVAEYSSVRKAREIAGLYNNRNKGLTH